jgi:hypothetical protein
LTSGSTLAIGLLPTAVTAGVELFATRVCYSGFSIGYNVCVAGFGATTPYVFTWLTAQTGNAVAPTYSVVVAAVVSLLTVLTLRETAGRPLARSKRTKCSNPPIKSQARHPAGRYGVTVDPCRPNPTT